jgi:acyl carrier protein
MSTITERVTAIIVKNLLVEKSEITMDSHFVNDLGADSIDLVELIMEFENEFNIEIPDEKAEEMHTVGNAIEFLEKQEKSKA